MTSDRFYACVSALSSPATFKSSVEGHADSVSILKYRCDKVRQLRADVDRLRSLVIDRLAEDMGRRLTCSPQ